MMDGNHSIDITDSDLIQSYPIPRLPPSREQIEKQIADAESMAQYPPKAWMNGLASAIPFSYPHDGIEFLVDAEARTHIVEEIKTKYWPRIRAKGYYLLVKMYVRPEKSAGGVLYTDETLGEDKYHANQAQVIDIGPTAYTKREFTQDKVWAKVGDWVMVPRIAGTLIGLKGASASEHFRLIKDDDVLAIIDTPHEWVVGTPK